MRSLSGIPQDLRSPLLNRSSTIAYTFKQSMFIYRFSHRVMEPLKLLTASHRDFRRTTVENLTQLRQGSLHGSRLSANLVQPPNLSAYDRQQTGSLKSSATSGGNRIFSRHNSSPIFSKIYTKIFLHYYADAANCLLHPQIPQHHLLQSQCTPPIIIPERGDHQGQDRVYHVFRQSGVAILDC